MVPGDVQQHPQSKIRTTDYRTGWGVDPGLGPGVRTHSGYRRMGNRLLPWSALLTAAQGEGRGVESREVLVTVRS